MDISLFLAKFWGWYLLIFFFILSFNPKRIKQIFDDLRDEKFLIIFASLAIILGLFSILMHNLWEFNYKLFATLMGWASLGIGLALFIFPRRTVNLLIILNIKLVQIIYSLLFLIGLYLLNKVYGIVPV